MPSDEHQALYLAAYVINSVNELTACLTRLCTSLSLDGNSTIPSSGAPALSYPSRISTQRLVDMLNMYGTTQGSNTGTTGAGGNTTGGDTNNTNSADVEAVNNEGEEDVTPPLQSPQRIARSKKGARSMLLTRVALFLSDMLVWKPTVEGCTVPSNIMHALRYSAFQLTHLVIFGSASFYGLLASSVGVGKGVNLPLQAEFMDVGGVQYFVE